MLIYVESKAFSYRTFVVRVQSDETIARVRAQLLHILYEISHEDHQFRLRFKGEYLRDGYTIQDYNIVDNAILKMVPLAKATDSVSDMMSVHDGSTSESLSHGLLPLIKQALKQEVHAFNLREKLIFHFNSVLYLHFLTSVLCFLSVYWFSGCWTILLWLLATVYCPMFTRIGGYIGTHSIHKTRFCILYGIGAILCLGAAVYFCVAQWILIVNHGCKDWEFVGDCSHSRVYTAVLFGFEAVLLLVSICLIFVLLHNMKIQCGDYVEKYLVKTRDIEDIMKTARSGRTKEKRVAAFELATMAASDDDNKFRIVAEGGLDVLIQMALSKDEATQEHAVEAIAELITVPVIQENYVEMGGVRNLMALLHSTNQRLVYQVATAISYIIAESEHNKSAVVMDHGLSDLSHAAQTENLTNQRLIAGIFLELVFNTEVRGQMASLNTPAEALIKLCWSADAETQRYALQTLELLAIESPDMICAQESLLELLLQLPSQIYDNKVLILAGKILLYFAENRETCELIQDQTNCKISLLKYARTKNSILQKVIVKVIYCMLEVRELRYRVRHLELSDVLTYIHDHAADRECWDMADQAIQLLNMDDDSSAILQLPALTTMEKMDKMAASPDKMAASEMSDQDQSVTGNSLGSRVSIRSGLHLHDDKKGID